MYSMVNSLGVVWNSMEKTKDEYDTSMWLVCGKIGICRETVFRYYDKGLKAPVWWKYRYGEKR